MSDAIDKVVRYGIDLFVQAQSLPRGPVREAKIARAASFLRRAGDRRKDPRQGRDGYGVPFEAVNFYALADLVAADEGCFGPVLL
ncbi:hypothetical protein [Bosea sp. FBZP-16]|uniref:hypothetical protein n=1 Tax=Bosea sp. FBZP-16 TaxID=2065382 RepID=UPI000C316568|nr:hypothetical protein [Bosea sp. FBZP-16]